MKTLLVFLITILSLVHSFNKDNIDTKKFQLKVQTQGQSETYPSKGQTVSVHYVGTLKNGQKFDSSRDRRIPFKFSLGVGQVIQCWDIVVADMAIGDKIFVTCPSDLAYGNQAIGNLIPPNSDLIFEIELLSID